MRNRMYVSVTRKMNYAKALFHEEIEVAYHLLPSSVLTHAYAAM